MADEKKKREEEERKRREDEEASNAGQIGIGFDPACGSFEPSIGIGGGLGIGMDGHITIG